MRYPIGVEDVEDVFEVLAKKVNEPTNWSPLQNHQNRRRLPGRRWCGTWRYLNRQGLSAGEVDVPQGPAGAGLRAGVRADISEEEAMKRLEETAWRSPPGARPPGPRAASRAQPRPAQVTTAAPHHLESPPRPAGRTSPAGPRQRSALPGGRPSRGHTDERHTLGPRLVAGLRRQVVPAAAPGDAGRGGPRRRLGPSPAPGLARWRPDRPAARPALRRGGHGKSAATPERHQPLHRRAAPNPWRANDAAVAIGVVAVAIVGLIIVLTSGTTTSGPPEPGPTTTEEQPDPTPTTGTTEDQGRRRRRRGRRDRRPTSWAGSTTTS